MVLLLLALKAAAGICPPLRIGYTDQARPPFLLGAGSQVMAPPGVLVELIEKTFVALHCKIALKRLPPARLVLALSRGEIDFALLPMSASTARQVILPAHPDGTLDRRRALRLYGTVFVRADDRAACESKPAEYFKSHRLGVVKEAQVANDPAFRNLWVDFGAHDVWINLEKLHQHRIDGTVAGLLNPGTLDLAIRARYGEQIVRLAAPFNVIDLTLASNAEFFRRYPDLVARSWDRVRDDWPRELAQLMGSIDRPAADENLLSLP